MPTVARRPKNRRRRTSSAAHYLLQVSAASPSARRRKRRVVWGWVLRGLVLVLLGAASYFGAVTLFDRFFFSNPEYMLKRIDLELDGVMNREEALVAAGLREGVNLFSVDLLAVERALLASAMVREVRVERILPDRLAVRVTARIAVARVSSSGEGGEILLLDASGLLMRPRRPLPEHEALPLITGLPADLLLEGKYLEEDGVLAALELLAELDRHPEFLLRPVEMDVSRSYRIAVVADDGALLLFGLEDVPDQLVRLQKLLLFSTESGRRIETANLMVKRNTPVVFAMSTSPNPGAVPAR
jgi:cell division septal protein FtsQ